MEADLSAILTTFSDLVFWGFCALAFLIGLLFWSRYL